MTGSAQKSLRLVCFFLFDAEGGFWRTVRLSPTPSSKASPWRRPRQVAKASKGQDCSCSGPLELLPDDRGTGDSSPWGRGLGILQNLHTRGQKDIWGYQGEESTHGTRHRPAHSCILCVCVFTGVNHTCG